jgi:hypothetical protein
MDEQAKAKFDFQLNDPPKHLRDRGPSRAELESNAATWRAAAAGAGGGRISG